MKKIEMYQCDICKRKHETEKAALDCESNHAKYKPVSIEHYTYDPDLDVPDSIFIKLANGEVKEYIAQIEFDDDDDIYEDDDDDDNDKPFSLAFLGNNDDDDDEEEDDED